MMLSTNQSQFIGFDGQLHSHSELDQFGTNDCCVFRNQIFSRNAPLSNCFRAEYFRLAKTSYKEANNRLRELDEFLNPLNLRLLSDDSDLVAAADSISLVCTEIRESSLSELDAYASLSRLSFAYGTEPPTLLPDKSNIFGALNRFCCAKYWRKQLRKLRANRAETVCRELRQVNAKKSLYCSDLTIYFRRIQKESSRDYLESRIAVNELDQEYTLAQLSELSPSNPYIRRVELITRLKGFEVIAKNYLHDAVFITITAPSRFHCMIKIVKNDRIIKCIPNKKFNGGTPRDAQEYLLSVWAKIQAKLSRQKIKPYGFRIAEPHHDGTPHHHFLLFGSTEHIQRIIKIFTEYSLQDSPDEKGATEHRCKFELIKKGINPKTGKDYSAVGYLIKYISKNVDGHRVDNSAVDKKYDWANKNAIDIAERIEAWSRTHRIRQFQQIGGASVTVWREVRRLTEQEGILEKIRTAARDNDWAAFVQAMGGPTVKREEQIVRPLYAPTEKLDRCSGEIKEVLFTQYGDLAAERVIGVLTAGIAVLSRIHHWEIRESEPLLRAQQKIMTGIADLLDEVHEQTYSHLYPPSFLQMPQAVA